MEIALSSIFVVTPSGSVENCSPIAVLSVKKLTKSQNVIHKLTIDQNLTSDM